MNTSDKFDDGYRSSINMPIIDQNLTLIFFNYWNHVFKIVLYNLKKLGRHMWRVLVNFNKCVFDDFLKFRLNECGPVMTATFPIINWWSFVPIFLDRIITKIKKTFLVGWGWGRGGESAGPLVGGTHLICIYTTSITYFSVWTFQWFILKLRSPIWAKWHLHTETTQPTHLVL